MKEIYVSAVAAIGKNRELGANNGLPWGDVLVTDMKRFRSTTSGHAVIMGKNTYDSLPDNVRPMPNRTNIVVTRRDFSEKGVIVVHSIEEAIKIGKEDEEKRGGTEVMVIGGGEILKLAMQYLDILHMTLIAGEFPNATVFFPEYKNDFEEVSSEKASAISKGEPYEYDFVDFKRKTA